jgi:hypothetical protein
MFLSVTTAETTNIRHFSKAYFRSTTNKELWLIGQEISPWRALAVRSEEKSRATTRRLIALVIL